MRTLDLSHTSKTYRALMIVLGLCCLVCSILAVASRHWGYLVKSPLGRHSGDFQAVTLVLFVILTRERVRLARP